MHCEVAAGAPLCSYHIMAGVKAERFYLVCFLLFITAENARRVPARLAGWDARKRLNMVNSLRLSRYSPLAKHFA